MYQNTRVKK